MISAAHGTEPPAAEAGRERPAIRLAATRMDGDDLHQAFAAAYDYIASLHRRVGVRQEPEERLACLRAALKASAIVAGEPGAAALFNDREEIFLLLVAQAIAESCADPRAVSPQGDLGWAQINHTMLAVLRVEDPFDVVQNTAGQARHMRALLMNHGKMWRGAKPEEEIVRLAVAAYNAGSRYVRSGDIPPGRVRAYANRVMRIYNALREETARRRQDTMAGRHGLSRFSV